MNYLAHLYLADPDPEHRLGNLIGDWIKGPLEGRNLPPRVLAGIRRHRMVDSYSDTHPVMTRARSRFPGRHRRVAGIALDVLWDHFLVRHWPRQRYGPLETFLGDCYADLWSVRHLWPDHAAPQVERIIREDWISGYHDLRLVGNALARIGRRLSRDPGLYDIIDCVDANYTELERDFLRFPLLHARQPVTRVLLTGRIEQGHP